MPGCSVSLSSEVLPQIREYYRLSTTVINAYLQPILARYIAQLDRRLGRRPGSKTPQKYIMQSNGGMATFAALRGRAVTTVLSGPAGGVTAGVLASRMMGFPNIITFDMGGTSCDVALIKDGEPLIVRAAARSPVAISRVPMLDINTVSAGGGTIAARRPLRRAPGRAAQRGRAAGTGLLWPRRRRRRPSPTATWCSAISARTIFSAARCGSMPPRRAAAVESKVARPLGLGVAEAAEGIVRIIDVKMEEAIKAISTMRGHDLRDFMLLAFGGAGPAACRAALRAISAWPALIVPLYPGVFSAIGLLMADVQHDYIQLEVDAARAKSTPRRR